ncbi:MAG TPA: polymer-forming cytoskeletal protein [Methylomirabilota bacterium]|nr:polymer-forming cytoskeletal protein [Methylomirabilota bacterium]
MPIDPMNNAVNASKNTLSSDVEIKGNIKFSGELNFDGKLEGDIHSDGSLQLGDNAVVNGNIHVSSIVVRGKITGNVTAKDKIEIKSKTELFGDISSSKLSIEEGVTFVGKTEVNPNKVAPTQTPAGKQSGEPPRLPDPAKAPAR